MKMLVIADDFTGANDTGVQMAKKGARTDVLLHGLQMGRSRADVLVVNTESRAESCAKAAAKVKDAVEKLCQSAETPPIIYKKIDSTFRGNVGAEIEAALLASQAKVAFVAAAIPAAGRITKNGNCLVNGVPLIETEFATDPKTPITSSHVGTLIQQQSSLHITEISLEEIRSGALVNKLLAIRQEKVVVVFDAENESDLSIIAEVITHYEKAYILVGAAGLANALPPALYLPEKQRLPVLVVAGSMSEATRKQIIFAQKTRTLDTIDIDVEQLLVPDAAANLNHIVRQAAEILRTRRHCVLRTCRDEQDRARIEELCEKWQLSRQDLGHKISQGLGEMTVAISACAQIGGLFLTGGDIAIAAARALNAEGYRIMGEVAPCIPWGTFVNSDIEDLPVITKAGGFGNENTLHDAIWFIEEMYSGK